ncbi:MAG TPA: hypothetical protein VMW27_11245 [Thermoanaerobaculia bacterium]|nr:hypothetical protein [Thermoanaerobaculia bacterium]
MIRRLTLSLVLLAAGTAHAAVPPLGDVAKVDEAPSCADNSPDVAPLADGGFVTVWGSALGDSPNGPFQLLGRFLNHDGRPRGPAFRLDAGHWASQPVAATDIAGNFMVVWSDSAIQGRVFSSFGAPLADDFVIAPPDQSQDHQVVAERDGGFTVAWLTGTTLLRRRYSADGQPLGTAEPLAGGLSNLTYAMAAHGDNGVIAVWMEPGFQVRAGIFHPGSAPILFPVHTHTSQTLSRFSFDRPFFAVASRPDGVALIAWRDVAGGSQTVSVRAFAGTGQPVGPVVRADEAARPDLSGLAGLQATVGAAGDFMVAWQGAGDEPYQRALYLRTFGRDGAPRGPAVAAGDSTQEPYAPALTASHDGGPGLLVWQDGQRGDWTGIGAPPCLSDGIYAQPLFSDCTGGESLCLRDGRFQVRAAWSLPDGQTGRGQAVALTRESGYFWFFGANNVELAVKILDGRVENGHFWVFYGALSDVGYTITVTDTVTGAVKTYVNPHSTLASRSDITAFPAAPAAASAVAVSDPSHLPPADGAGPCFDPSLPVTRRPGLCLNGERFEVEVAWHDPFHGTSGIATGVPLTGDSGYFWFFGEDNLELVVKVLDGRSYNGKFWVFYGALTNVEYTVRVRHVESGAERIYHNPPFQFRSRSDINAFSITE